MYQNCLSKIDFKTSKWLFGCMDILPLDAFWEIFGINSAIIGYFARTKSGCCTKNQFCSRETFPRASFREAFWYTTLWYFDTQLTFWYTFDTFDNWHFDTQLIEWFNFNHQIFENSKEYWILLVIYHSNSQDDQEKNTRSPNRMQNLQNALFLHISPQREDT